MLIFIEGKNFLGRTFSLSCDQSTTVDQLKAIILHILHDINYEDDTFQLSYEGSYLKESLTLQEYGIVEMCVLQMVPISFGRGIKANTSVSTPQSFIALSRTNDPLGGKESRTAVMNALRMEVSLFKRRDRILKILKVLLWSFLTLSVLTFASVYWWSGLWIGSLALVGLYFMPSYTYIGGTTERIKKRDIYVMVVYAVTFLSLSLFSIGIFIYTLMTSSCIPGSPYLNSLSGPGCSPQVWFSLFLLPFQTILFLSGALVSLVARINLKFEVGSLMKPALLRARNIKEMIEIAETGKVRYKRQAAFELSNMALLGDQSKVEIAGQGGLQCLISLVSGDDNVTQEYAVEAIALLLTHPPIQVKFLSLGGVSTLCALLCSPNEFVVHKAAISLTLLSSDASKNSCRETIASENGLDDILYALKKGYWNTRPFLLQILMDLVNSNSSKFLLTRHSGLLDALVATAGRQEGGVAVGEEEEEEGLHEILVLQRLGELEPRVILQRAAVLIPELLKYIDQLEHHYKFKIQQAALQMLLLCANDVQGLQLLVSHNNLLTALRKFASSISTTNNQASSILISIVQRLMERNSLRTELVLQDLRGFLEYLNSHSSEQMVLTMVDTWLEML